LSAAAPATEEEGAAVASVLGRAEGGWDGGVRTEADGHAAYGGHAARARRHLLLPALHAVQERIGWISPGALDHICARLTVPPAEAYGVASFYALFRTPPAAATGVPGSDDIACQVDRAQQGCDGMGRRFGPEGSGPEGSAPTGATPSSNGSSPHATPAPANAAPANGAGISWQRSPCLGQCDRGSAAMVQLAGPAPARVVLAPVDA